MSDHALMSKVRFGLPALAVDPFRYSSMRARSNPITHNIHMFKPLPSLEKHLFYPTQEDRICAIVCYLDQPQEDIFICKLFVHIRVFLGMDHSVSTFLSESPGRTVPWEVWGPRNTRWRLDSWTDQPYSLYGLRAIDTIPHPDFAYRLQVWDFNPYAPSTLDPEGEASLEDWRRGRVVKECL